jgi:DNA-binding response OmpR family regulator
VKRKTGRVMVVCSDLADKLETRLVSNGWVVVWVYDAKTAIAKVRRERFDLVVLISTGLEMDITETLFNLRDIRRSMPIAVVQPSGDSEDASAKLAYLPADHNLIAVRDLDDLLTLLQAQESSIVRPSSSDRPQF